LGIARLSCLNIPHYFVYRKLFLRLLYGAIAYRLTRWFSTSYGGAAAAPS